MHVQDRKLILLALFVLVLSSAACGELKGKGGGDSTGTDATGAPETASTEATGAEAGGTDEKTAGQDELAVTDLKSLAPGELARKIYDAFGAGMTSVDDGNKSYDFLDVNGTSFVGSISTDPSNKFASQFSIGYFLALAGLSTVVGDNYTMKLYNGQVTHDCRKDDGAAAILQVTAPTMNAVELVALTKALVAACQEDPASSVKALVQSYSFALRI